MGPRLLIAALVTVLLGLGAWLATSQPSSPRPDVHRAAEDPARQADGDVTLESLAGGGQRSGLEDTVGPTHWTVLARVADGRPAEDARILARAGSASLTASGTAEWQDVDPGTWRLRVEASDGQVIERDVTLVPGKENRTYVRLGMPAQVKGTVMNSRGERLGSHLVCFLRPDEEVPRERRRMRGLVSTSTDLSGAFQVDLPETGRWRPVVIFGGKVLHEGAFEAIDPDGLARRCDIVIPASPRLIVTLEDFEEIKASGELVAVSVYRPSTPQELQELEDWRRRREEQQGQPREERDDPDFQEELARAEAIAKDPARLARVEKQKKWMSVVPEGWRSVGSSTLPASGQLVFDQLDHDRKYLLALRRGDEVLRVDGGVVIGFGEVLRAHLIAPPPVPDPASLSVLRSASLALQPLTIQGEPLVPGATWDR